MPDERLAKVATQYEAIGGRSPINDQTRDLIAALRSGLKSAKLTFLSTGATAIGFRFFVVLWPRWRPTADTTRAAFVTSAYSSYSSCRQYREDIASAQASVRTRPLSIKSASFTIGPDSWSLCIRNTRQALEAFENTDDVALIFTAHSIPTAMAANARYEAQLIETAAVIANAFDNRYSWTLTYQSRSGSPQTPWLEPDVNDHLRELHDKAIDKAVIIPIGFISDHVEVMYDLDNEARATAAELGMHVERGATPGTDPQFISMIADFIPKK